MTELESTKALHKSPAKIIYISCYCFLLAVYIFFTLQKGYSIIACGTPKELREMTSVAIAHQFAYGKNPYSSSVLRQNMPSVTSIYGLLVPLLMSPFIRLFSITPLSALQTCQLLTLIVEIVGSVFFYRLLVRKTEHHLLSLVGAFLFHTCYWRYSAFGGAFPDQWGLTLSIILMDLLNADEQKNHYRPPLYAAGVIGLFYIKQYFVLIVVGLCIYLLVHSRRDLIRLIIYGALMGSLSVIFIYLLFPLYFSEVFPIAHGQTITGASSYSVTQLIHLSVYYGPVVLSAAIGFLVNAYHMIRNKQLRGEVCYELCQIIFIFPPLFRIAENQGTNYTYYLQLWYPYIILYGTVSATALLKHLNQKSAVLISADNGKTLLLKMCFLSVCLLAALSLLKVLPSCRCPSMTREQRESWHHAYNLLDRYSSEGDILVSMVLSNYCLERGIATSNYGQAEYNNLHNLENYKNNKLWRNIFLFDNTEKLLQQNISYNQTVREKIYDQSYRCIALVYAGEYHLAEDDLIAAGYHVTAAEELQTGTQCWYTVFYTTID